MKNWRAEQAVESFSPAPAHFHCHVLLIRPGKNQKKKKKQNAKREAHNSPHRGGTLDCQGLGKYSLLAGIWTRPTALAVAEWKLSSVKFAHQIFLFVFVFCSFLWALLCAVRGINHRWGAKMCKFTGWLAARTQKAHYGQNGNRNGQ